MARFGSDGFTCEARWHACERCAGRCAKTLHVCKSALRRALLAPRLGDGVLEKEARLPLRADARQHASLGRGHGGESAEARKCAQRLGVKRKPRARVPPAAGRQPTGEPPERLVRTGRPDSQRRAGARQRAQRSAKRRRSRRARVLRKRFPTHSACGARCLVLARAQQGLGRRWSDWQRPPRPVDPLR